MIGRFLRTDDRLFPAAFPWLRRLSLAIGGATLLLSSPSSATNLTDTSLKADYVVNVPTALDSALLTPLRARREADSLTVLFASSGDIGAQFGSGVFDSTAIRGFLSYAYENWASMPQFVVLVGDADVTGGAGNLIPAPQGHHRNVYQGDTTFAWDDWYTDVSGNDSIPDLIIARIPVRSNSDISAYVNKVVQYETALPGGAWKTTSAFFVGNASCNVENALQKVFADSIRDYSLPSSITTRTIYGTTYDCDYAASEVAVKDTLNAGALLTHAFGNNIGDFNFVHLLDFNAASLPTFRTDELTATGKYPLLIGSTCLTNNLDVAATTAMPRSVAEDFLLTAGKGMIGSIAPNHVAGTYENFWLGQKLEEEIFKRGTRKLGQICIGGRKSLLEARGYARDIFLQTELLGDPGLKLALASSFQDNPNEFASGFELEDPLPRQNRLLSKSNVSSDRCRVSEAEAGVTSLAGARMMKCEGYDDSPGGPSASASAEYKIFDNDLGIDGTTGLDFWLYVAASPPGSTSGPFGLDGQLFGGSTLGTFSVSGQYLTDQYGMRLDAALRTIPLGQWRYYYVDLSRAQGDGLDYFSIRYHDNGLRSAGDFRVFVDNLRLTAIRPSVVFNLSFEEDVNGDTIPDAWSGLALDDSKNITRSTFGGAHSGLWSAQIDDTVAVGYGGLSQRVTVDNRFSTPSAIFWARASTAGATLRLELEKPGGGFTTSQTLSVGTEWAQYFANTLAAQGLSVFEDYYLNFRPVTEGVTYWIDDVVFSHEIPTSLASTDAGQRSLSLTLLPNTPNPFNPQTTIPFDLSSSSHSTLRVFDSSGRVVRVFESDLGPGRHAVEWDGRDRQGREVGSGVYFFRLEALGKAETRQAVLLR